MMDMNRPIHIVMTPTRNEAWVIRAFLECNGLWADYIIIADQMSTDGTREIISEYIDKWKEKGGKCKVIMIDNTNPEFNEAERQSMLVAKAREMAAGRDTLLWGLDADEILSANWQDTEDGRHILNSVKGDVFWFKWANIANDKVHYGEGVCEPWLFHDDGVEPHGNYVRNMHSMRIPYPIEEKQMFYVKDFHVLHCGFMSPNRTAAKNRFYQFVDWEMNKRNPISLGRTYYAHYRKNIRYDTSFEIEKEAIAYPFDVWSLVDLDATHTWFDDYIKERLTRYPMDQLRKLDIWDDEFLEHYAIEDKRRWIDKCIHGYLHKTDKCKRSIVIRGIDKIMKKVY